MPYSSAKVIWVRLHKVLDGVTDRPIDRNPGTAGSDTSHLTLAQTHKHNTQKVKMSSERTWVVGNRGVVGKRW